MRKTALITGSASGLGYEFARFMAGKGYNLVLVDILNQELTDTHNTLENEFDIEILSITKDLAEPDSADFVYDQIKSNNIKIDLLINNAGFGDFGFFYKTDWRKENRLLQLNMVTLTQLTKLFLQDMVNQGEGKIINVASAAGFQPGPLMALYYASKSYVVSFTQSISREVRSKGVKITVVCPGVIITGFNKACGVPESYLLKKSVLLTKPEFVVNKAYKAVNRGQAIIIPGLFNYLMVNIGRFLTRNIITNIVWRIQKKQLKNPGK